jgi:hypothetical protein
MISLSELNDRTPLNVNNVRQTKYNFVRFSDTIWHMIDRIKDSHQGFYN